MGGIDRLETLFESIMKEEANEAMLKAANIIKGGKDRKALHDDEKYQERLRVYKEEVSGRMQDIIETCKKHGINVAARFQISNAAADDGSYVSTVVNQIKPTATQAEISRIIHADAAVAEDGVNIEDHE